ncbi:MAG: 3-deoxy-D-manno-octulosonic acid transferase, partial [Paracoccaceae bacterium]
TVFVGGSLVAKGGHTPYEPAAFGCALLHGPHLDNFGPAYGRLAEAGAARQVADAETLGRALVELADPAVQAAQARRARAALARRDAPDAVLAALLQHLPAPEDSG